MEREEKHGGKAKTKMQNALKSLLKKKQFNLITVKELCEEAEVNRSTFYAHYENTYELLLEMHQSVMSEFYEQFNGERNINGDISSGYFITDKYLLPYLDFVKKNRHIFIAYTTDIANIANKAYTELLSTVFRPAFERRGITDEVTILYCTKFYLQGITTIALEWIKRDCSDNPQKICDIIKTCLSGTSLD